MTTKKKKSSFTWFAVALLLVVAGGGVWYSMNRGSEGRAEYRTTKVQRGDVTQAVTASGTINPVTTVQVGSQVSGQIQKLLVDFNAPVEKGQVIAQLDPATHKAQVTQAEGELASARANLELARANRERSEALFEKGAIPKSVLDKVVAEFSQAQATVQIREAVLQRNMVDLERTTIHSPIDGVVISRNVDVGQTVAASLSAPTLFLIANDLSKMQINASVAEADIGNVEAGQEVSFTVDAFPNRKFRGTVSQVRNSPVNVQNVVSYDTIISVENPELKLKPGMTANVSIIVARRENVLLLSNAAMRFRPSQETREAAPSSRVSERPPRQDGAQEGSRNGAAGAAGAERSPGGQPAGAQGGREGRRRSPGVGGGEDGAGGRRRGGGERNERSVYVLKDAAIGTYEKLSVRTGITDGVQTEILSGLEEGAEVITGEISSDSSTPSGSSSPFGGGSGRMRRI